MASIWEDLLANSHGVVGAALRQRRANQAIQDAISAGFLAGTNPTQDELRSVVQTDSGPILAPVPQRTEALPGGGTRTYFDTGQRRGEQEVALTLNTPEASQEAERLQQLQRLKNAGIDPGDYLTQIRADEFKRALADPSLSAYSRANLAGGHPAHLWDVKSGTLFQPDSPDAQMRATPQAQALIDLRGEQVNTERAQQGSYAAQAGYADSRTQMVDFRRKALEEFRRGGDPYAGMAGGARMPTALAAGIVKDAMVDGKPVRVRVLPQADGSARYVPITGADGQPLEVPPHEFSPERRTAAQSEAAWRAEMFPGTTAQEWDEVKMLPEYSRGTAIERLKAKSAEYQKNRPATSPVPAQASGAEHPDYGRARKALSMGADPAKVGALLRAKGLDPARIGLK